MPQTIQGEVPKDILTGIAITSLMFAISAYMPIFSFLSLFIPLPILFYRSKLGRKTGGIVPVASAIVMLIMLGGISVGVLFYVKLLLLGFVLGEFIEMDISIEKTVLYACVTVLMTGFVGLLFYNNISGTNIVTLVSEYVTRVIDLMIELLRAMEAPEKNIHTILRIREDIHFFIIRFIPAYIVASTLFEAWISLLIARPVLKSRNLFYPDFGSLNLWKAPEFLVWGVIGCGLMLLFSDPGFKIFGLSGLFVLMMIYFFQGVAIISFYFQKKRFPRVLRFFLYSLVILQPMVIMFLVVGLGFFDMWTDFRKLETQKKE